MHKSLLLSAIFLVTIVTSLSATSSDASEVKVYTKKILLDALVKNCNDPHCAETNTLMLNVLVSTLNPKESISPKVKAYYKKEFTEICKQPNCLEASKELIKSVIQK
jgi:hypothetical protein